MAKSKYKERILEELRLCNAKKQMLEQILKDCREREGEEDDGESNVSDR